MANVMNYASEFQSNLIQKYTRELLTSGLTTANVSFSGAKIIKLPYLTLAGFKNHGRNGGFNRQDVQTGFLSFTLAHDRDVEFFVDKMDVDETNQAAAAANITNTFEEQFAIPETDAYRMSKLYSELLSKSGTADATVLSAENVLSVFDGFMQEMSDNEVPSEGRILYVTPAVNKYLKQAANIQHTVAIDNSTGAMNRNVYTLDGVSIVEIMPSRMKTAYDFANGFTPASGAKQINMALVHPKSVIAVNKHSYIKLWPEGTHTAGDGYLYQNRQYWDLFVIENRKAGVMMNVTNAL